MKRQLKQTAAIILAAAMVMSGVSIGAAADPVVAEAGPQPEMYLKFDGNAQDASGNGYTLTGRGAASGISYINGVNGQALQLKGQCFLEVNEAVTLGAGDYTFSFWLKDYGTPKWTYVMGNQNYGKADSEPGTGVIFNAPDDMYLDIAYGSDTFRTAQSLSIRDQWVHVVYSVDRDGKIVLYQNGRKITEYDCPADAQNFDVNSAGLAFMIGAGTDSANHSYFAAENNFALDEVKIYKSALSADDVQAEYASSAYLAQDYELRLTFDDENAADQSGNGYDFTDKGTTHVTYEKGINGGKAARFTGDSYMGLSAGKNLLLGTGDYSFSFWIKDEGTAQCTYVMGNQDYSVGENARGTGVMISPAGQMYLAMADGSAYVKTQTSAIAADGGWAHVVYAVDREGGVTVYQNGEKLEGPVSIPAGKQEQTVDSGLPFLIGGGNNWHCGDDPNYGPNNFLLDDVRVYKRELSGEEAKTLSYRELPNHAGNLSFADTSVSLDEMRGFVAEVLSDLDEPNFSRIVWSTSDKKIAQVQTFENYPQIATIHGLKAGTAKVTATDETTGKKVEMTVTVHPVTVDMDNLQVFFGDLHAHTGDSDGAGDPGTDQWYKDRGFDTFWNEGRRSKPADAFKHAKEKGNADFLFITDHHYGPAGGGKLTTQQYLDGIAAAKQYTSEDFLAVIGYEASGYFGHMNVFGGSYDQMFTYPTGSSYSLDSVVFPSGGSAAQKQELWNKGLQGFYDVLAASPTLLAQWNHPTDLWNNVWDFDEYGRYSEELDRVINTLEIINFLSIQDTKVGHFEKSYIQALDAGWHVAPTGNSDIHQGNWITGYETRTAVLTDELTETKIYDAIRKHRTYATDDSNLLIDYKVNGQVLGSELDGSTNTFRFQIKVSDPDTTVAKDKLKSIEIVSDGGKVLKTIPVDAYSADLDFTLTSATATYFYVRVKDAEKKIANADYVAYTAPIWTGLNPDAGAAADEEKAALVAEKIDAIGTVTLESKAKIEQARAAYDALTEAQKKLVNNYAVLQAAEEAYRQLTKPSKPTTEPSKPTTEPGQSGNETPAPGPSTGVAIGGTAALLAAGAGAALLMLLKKKASKQ